MIDISKLDYSVKVIDEKGAKHNIKQYVENLGWEENENEIATRITFTVRDSRTTAGFLSGVIKPGCVVIVYASTGGKKKEVARGTVVTWTFQKQNAGRELKVTCYDILYNLQQSQDNYYLPSGTGTKAAIQNILKKWKIPLGTYKGPDVKHGKKNYKNKYLSDILRSILNNAAKKDGKKYIMRASNGKVQIVPKGSNTTVYYFDTLNSKALSNNISTADMVTRVRVYGKEEKNKKRAVVATVDGKTEFGIRQKIYQCESDESLADAKKSAEAILKKEGRTDRDLTVSAVGVPFVRKGDQVYINLGATKGFYYVKQIQHDADNCTMTMRISRVTERSGKEKQSEGGSEKKDYAAGDVVQFKGGTHYVSSYPGSKGYPARAGRAKIVRKNGSGKAHPWLLIHADSKSNVYGWVDNGTFE